MSSINKDTVRYIARLARIDLNEEELEYYSCQLSQILEYVEKINRLDLDDVPAELNPNPEKNVYRQDRAEIFDNVRGLLDIVPLKEEDFIKIPKVIE
jgi:aspartyl-tRNA(Asn)/glutamyl-tRNA(Gln) amidotransferase subunit C